MTGTSDKTQYTVALLTPNVDAMVVADSPFACIRWARAAFWASRAFGPGRHRRTTSAARFCSRGSCLPS